MMYSLCTLQKCFNLSCENILWYIVDFSLFVQHFLSYSYTLDYSKNMLNIWEDIHYVSTFSNLLKLTNFQLLQ